MHNGGLSPVSSRFLWVFSHTSIQQCSGIAPTHTSLTILAFYCTTHTHYYTFFIEMKIRILLFDERGGETAAVQYQIEDYGWGLNAHSSVCNAP